jgi:GNAT superfamily N-acetyltransferase
MKNIVVKYGNEEKKSMQDRLTMLLKDNYLRDKRLNYLPESNNIIPYLELNDVIILYYYYADTIIGTITLRPVECILGGNTVYLQYVDYLCVHKEHRKKGIAQQLIGTLYYYQRHNSYYKVSLFKNEGKQRAIIPFAKYETYRIKLAVIPNLKLHPEYTFTKVTDKNIYKLYEIFSQIKADFLYYISVNLTNLLLLITTGNIELYYLSHKDVILSLYYVRNSHCYNEDNKIVKEIYCSYKAQKCSKEYFQNGFQLLLHKLQEQSYESIIENVGHTIWLVDWLKSSGYIITIDMYLVGYYLYNYLHKTVDSTHLFINL